MALWRFAPVAEADDPGWLDFDRWEEVVVRADNLGLALATAVHELGHPDHPTGNESPAGTTGLESEKLYRVRRVEPEDVPDLDAPPDGPPAVLRAIRAEAAGPGTPAADLLPGG